MYQKRNQIKKLIANNVQAYYLKNKHFFPVQTLRGHKKPITACCIDNKTKDVYTVAKDAAIIRFLKEKNYEREIFCDSFYKNKSGHKRKIFAICISFDGKYLVTGGQDREVKIWDVKSQKLLKSLKGHSKAIHSLCFK